MHCPEDTIPFIASWYPLAMGMMAIVGALAFPRFVRW
ncbi:NrsF family protein [Cupriavidus sp. 2MCAB6]